MTTTLRAAIPSVPCSDEEDAHATVRLSGFNGIKATLDEELEESRLGRMSDSDRAQGWRCERPYGELTVLHVHEHDQTQTV